MERPRSLARRAMVREPSRGTRGRAVEAAPVGVWQCDQHELHGLVDAFGAVPQPSSRSYEGHPDRGARARRERREPQRRHALEHEHRSRPESSYRAERQGLSAATVDAPAADAPGAQPAGGHCGREGSSQSDGASGSVGTSSGAVPAPSQPYPASASASTVSTPRWPRRPPQPRPCHLPLPCLASPDAAHPFRQP